MEDISHASGHSLGGEKDPFLGFDGDISDEFLSGVDPSMFDEFQDLSTPSLSNFSQVLEDITASVAKSDEKAPAAPSDFQRARPQMLKRLAPESEENKAKRAKTFNFMLSAVKSRITKSFLVGVVEASPFLQRLLTHCPSAICFHLLAPLEDYHSDTGCACLRVEVFHNKKTSQVFVGVQEEEFVALFMDHGSDIVCDETFSVHYVLPDSKKRSNIQPLVLRLDVEMKKTDLPWYWTKEKFMQQLRFFLEKTLDLADDERDNLTLFVFSTAEDDSKFSLRIIANVGFFEEQDRCYLFEKQRPIMEHAMKLCSRHDKYDHLVWPGADGKVVWILDWAKLNRASQSMRMPFFHKIVAEQEKRTRPVGSTQFLFSPALSIFPRDADHLKREAFDHLAWYLPAGILAPEKIWAENLDETPKKHLAALALKWSFFGEDELILRQFCIEKTGSSIHPFSYTIENRNPAVPPLYLHDKKREINALLRNILQKIKNISPDIAERFLDGCSLRLKSYANAPRNFYCEKLVWADQKGACICSGKVHEPGKAFITFCALPNSKKHEMNLVISCHKSECRHDAIPAISFIPGFDKDADKLAHLVWPQEKAPMLLSNAVLHVKSGAESSFAHITTLPEQAGVQFEPIPDPKTHPVFRMPLFRKNLQSAVSKKKKGKKDDAEEGNNNDGAMQDEDDDKMLRPVCQGEPMHLSFSNIPVTDCSYTSTSTLRGEAQKTFNLGAIPRRSGVTPAAGPLARNLPVCFGETNLFIHFLYFRFIHYGNYGLPNVKIEKKDGKWDQATSLAYIIKLGLTVHGPKGIFVDIMGPQGCGKSTHNKMWHTILGPDHCRIVQDTKSVFGAQGGFNSLAENLACCIVEETILKTEEQMAAAREMATGNSQILTKKFQDSRVVPNSTLLIFTNNRDSLLAATDAHNSKGNFTAERREKGIDAGHNENEPSKLEFKRLNEIAEDPFAMGLMFEFNVTNPRADLVANNDELYVPSSALPCSAAYCYVEYCLVEQGCLPFLDTDREVVYKYMDGKKPQYFVSAPDDVKPFTDAIVHVVDKIGPEVPNSRKLKTWVQEGHNIQQFLVDLVAASVRNKKPIIINMNPKKVGKQFVLCKPRQLMENIAAFFGFPLQGLIDQWAKKARQRNCEDNAFLLQLGAITRKEQVAEANEEARERATFFKFVLDDDTKPPAGSCELKRYDGLVELDKTSGISDVVAGHIWHISDLRHLKSIHVEDLNGTERSKKVVRRFSVFFIAHRPMLDPNCNHKLVSIALLGTLAYLSYTCPCDQFMSCHKEVYYASLLALALLPGLRP